MCLSFVSESLLLRGVNLSFCVSHVLRKHTMILFLDAKTFVSIVNVQGVSC